MDLSLVKYHDAKERAITNWPKAITNSEVQNQQNRRYKNAYFEFVVYEYVRYEYGMPAWVPVLVITSPEEAR